MARFRKKPVEIEAVCWEGDNLGEIRDFIGVSTLLEFDGGVMYINTLEGKMKAIKGDWIVKGVKGEFYPCKPDIFEQTYEMVASA